MGGRTDGVDPVFWFLGRLFREICAQDGRGGPVVEERLCFIGLD